MDQPIRKSYLGTPIMTNVIFRLPPREYRLPNLISEDNKEIELIDFIAVVSQSKNIVTTPLVRPQGYTDVPTDNTLKRGQFFSGTVKEYISMGDYEIDLQGYLVGQENGQFPEKELSNLIEYLEYPGAFPISGQFLVFFDSFDQVVVKNYTISQQRGMFNMIPIRIQLLSDDFIDTKYEPEQSGTVIT